MSKINKIMNLFKKYQLITNIYLFKLFNFEFIK
jgi:hypothetical protein